MIMSRMTCSEERRFLDMVTFTSKRDERNNVRYEKRSVISDIFKRKLSPIYRGSKITHVQLSKRSHARHTGQKKVF